jgi:hypothetical protein
MLPQVAEKPGSTGKIAGNGGGPENGREPAPAAVAPAAAQPAAEMPQTAAIRESPRRMRLLDRITGIGKS